MGGGDAEAVARLLDPATGPVVLPPLYGPEERRAVLVEILKRVGSTVRPPDLEASPRFEERLGEITWGGEPLFLLMAGLVAARASFGEVLALSATDLGFRIAGHEIHRIHEIARARDIPEDLLAHLAAYVTLCQGLGQTEIEGLVEEEERALGCRAAGGPLAIYKALFAALPGEQGAVAPVLPDVVGEAVILEALGARAEEKALAAISRAAGQARERVQASLIHLAQDYGAVRREPVRWFERLAAGSAVDLASLVALLDQLPESSLALREVAAALTERAVALAREQEACVALPGLLNDLSNRLCDLGKLEEALTAIEEAVAIRRELAASQPDAFRPGLALSLNNLSGRLGDLGRREEALAAIKEAVELYRELAVLHLDAFRPHLASSLNNLAVYLGDLGRREEALAAVKEAAELYRKLAALRPDAFRPDLAMALNNLHLRLNDIRRWPEALEAIEEVVGINRELAASNPDAFRPDLARSLNNLSNALGNLGRLEEALETIEEAVASRRALAESRPAAFRPDLASSLNNFSSRLRALERWEMALEVIEEAVKLYRELAALRPEVFQTKLAASLGNLSLCMDALGRQDAALEAVEEALRTLAPHFFDYPAALEPWMRSMVADYLQAAQKAGREPDLKLLTPIQSWLDPASSQESAK